MEGEGTQGQAKDRQRHVPFLVFGIGKAVKQHKKQHLCELQLHRSQVPRSLRHPEKEWHSLHKTADLSVTNKEAQFPFHLRKFMERAKRP